MCLRVLSFPQDEAWAENAQEPKPFKIGHNVKILLECILLFHCPFLSYISSRQSKAPHPWVCCSKVKADNVLKYPRTKNVYIV